MDRPGPRPLVIALVVLAACAATTAVAQLEDSAQPPAVDDSAGSLENSNKALARGFYEDLWFNDRTDRYAQYVADSYVVHDTGDRKGVTEPAIEQKRIADFFHANGEMTGSIDYQIAEGDLVATRWQWKFQPRSLMFRVMGGRNPIPIINVFRFRDGKIVEIWNHRHDIDTGAGNFGFVRGLGIGLLVALAGWLAAFFAWRKARRLSRAATAAA